MHSGYASGHATRGPRPSARGAFGSRGSGWLTSAGDDTAKCVVLTRTRARASLDYRREAVVDDDVDALGAVVGEGGVDGDPADEQLNDLAALGIREVALKALTDLREHILGDGVVKSVIFGFDMGEAVIKGIQFPFHVCGNGVELYVGELGAGIEVDGAHAAILD